MPIADCTTFQPEMTIYKQCCTCCRPPVPPCPLFPPCGSTECDCAAQVRNIITQLLARLPSGTSVTFYGGTSAAFTASVQYISIAGTNSDLLVLRTAAGALIAALPICEIQQITVLNSALTGITLTYLAPPAAAPLTCQAKCEADLRAFIGTLGSTASFRVVTNNFNDTTGPIVQNQYGLITQIEGTGDTATANFISTCAVSAITPAA